MPDNKNQVRSLNQSFDLTEIQEALDDRLAVELLEERLELDCWVKCDLCLNLTG